LLPPIGLYGLDELMASFGGGCLRSDGERGKGYCEAEKSGGHRFILRRRSNEKEGLPLERRRPLFRAVAHAVFCG
jgi:hypothetical protein